MHRPHNAPAEFWVVELMEPTINISLGFFWNGHVEPGWRAVSTPKLMEAQKYYTRESAELDLKKLMTSTKLGVWKVTKQRWPDGV